MKFTLVFVRKYKDKTTEEVVAIGECLEDMPEAFEEMPYWRTYWYECRPYNGEKVGDIAEFEK